MLREISFQYSHVEYIERCEKIFDLTAKMNECYSQDVLVLKLCFLQTFIFFYLHKFEMYTWEMTIYFFRLKYIFCSGIFMIACSFMSICRIFSFKSQFCRGFLFEIIFLSSIRYITHNIDRQGLFFDNTVNLLWKKVRGIKNKLVQIL